MSRIDDGPYKIYSDFRIITNKRQNNNNNNNENILGFHP